MSDERKIRIVHIQCNKRGANEFRLPHPVLIGVVTNPDAMFNTDWNWFATSCMKLACPLSCETYYCIALNFSAN